MSKLPSPRGTLRQRILALVGAFVLLSLFGSSISLYRITEVNRQLDAINKVSVPLGRLFVQLQSDADVYHRELERRLGQPHWADPHWHARPVPRWIEDVIESEVGRASELIGKDLPWSAPESRESWHAWVSGQQQGFISLKDQAAKVYLALDQHDSQVAAQLYPELVSSMDNWIRQLQWGVNDYERSLRQSFTIAESRVAQLRTGLEIILVVVISLSLLLLWLGERALRPLTDLTLLVRDITRRGLRKEDKTALPDISLSRNDEVGRLAREFHRMATALLEREKIVDTQKTRLQDQNRLLRDMGELNNNILKSIDSVLIVTDLAGQVTQCNPIAAVWLGETPERIINSHLSHWPKLRGFTGAENWLSRIRDLGEAVKIEPTQVEGRVYGGHLLPLKQSAQGAHGAIIVLEDLTDELNLQERLRYAEKLAAVGQMSAQVAHEVRNPLHSIGLEAEMAVELAARLGNPQLKESLASILTAVDRLEKITENYLKLSRLSTGEKTVFDLGEVLDSVLATYAFTFESQGVQVEWEREQSAVLRVNGDRDLLENVLGNLLKNSIQALMESGSAIGTRPKVMWKLGSAESGRIWIRIEDNGPGIDPEAKDRLFTPFFTTRAQGTGLGLSFVKKVVEDHGGTIVCLERLSGQGAAFEICLPQAVVTPPALKKKISLPTEVNAHV